ncbi:hypothetical protein WDU94_010844 [Cyamophila willieti]
MEVWQETISEEEKRKKFHDYLKETGLMENFTRAVASVSIEPNKPKEPLPYILNYLQTGVGACPSCEEKDLRIDNLKKEILEQDNKLIALQMEAEKLKYVPPTPSKTSPKAPAKAGNSFKTVRHYNNFAQKANHPTSCRKCIMMYDDGECLIRIGVRSTIT